jgi:hypothetical protein
MKNILLALPLGSCKSQGKADFMSVYTVHSKFSYKQTVFVNFRRKKFEVNEKQRRLPLATILVGHFCVPTNH